MSPPVSRKTTKPSSKSRPAVNGSIVVPVRRAAARVTRCRQPAPAGRRVRADRFEESLKVRRNILEPGHPDIALSMSNMGVIHWQNKQPEKAFAALTEAVDLLEKKVGPSSSLTALAKNNLAFAKKEAREYDEAIRLYEEVLSVRKQVLGSAHNETIMARHNLAEAYRSSGNEDKAVEIQNEILELFDAELGPEDKK
ncbi:hypothetical protein ON010_g7585 [Phytophthora cinnamomi]|nr:hypothetical protein ON010_g7585 [Phytophthora cinnamomi]